MAYRYAMRKNGSAKRSFAHRIVKFAQGEKTIEQRCTQSGL
jgi:hypothetical protein